MPENYDEFPVLWDEQDLAWLKGSPLLEDTLEFLSFLQNDYNNIKAAIDGFDKEYSEREYIEMWIAAESRQLNNKDFGVYIIPFVDMFNHDKGLNIAVKYRDTTMTTDIGVYVTARSDIAKGDQLFWHYGNKGNFEFLKLYGFVLTDGTQPLTYYFSWPIKSSTVVVGDPEDFDKE